MLGRRSLDCSAVYSVEFVHNSRRRNRPGSSPAQRRMHPRAGPGRRTRHLRADRPNICVLFLESSRAETRRAATRIPCRTRQSPINRFVSVFQGKQYVRAVADYVTKQPNLLSFKKGDVVQLIRDCDSSESDTAAADNGQPGWLYGKLAGRFGNFPSDYVEPITEKHVAQPPLQSQLSHGDFGSSGLVSSSLRCEPPNCRAIGSYILH